MVPWIEKYRPSQLDNIVLTPENRMIIETMLKESSIPNLLFYGPPGTGKTTTIMNLIHKYQVEHLETNQGLVLHLNASDDRGIEVIRSQIYTFINSKNLLGKGTKFVILDEVDYMTKTAQYALRYILHTPGVRFCLIGNYISKIEESLQTDVMNIRFDHLPTEKIIYFLKDIAIKEGVNVSDEILKEIQRMHGSDLRSMINFMQSNELENCKVMGPVLWDKLTSLIHEKENVTRVIQYINELSQEYETDHKTLVKDWMTYALLNNHFSEVDIKQVKHSVHHMEESNHSMTLLILTLLS